MALLVDLGLEIDVRPAGIPEEHVPGESPEAHVRRLAEAKARHVAERAGERPAAGIVLAADTVVVLDGRILGKPRDEDDARRMLLDLSGRDHRVLSGVCVLRTDGRGEASSVTETRVRFRAYDAAVVDWYVATGEPMDKAGAYGIQGRGALLSESIDGSWSNVVGLPLESLPELLARIGIELRSLLP
jgi:septum formation protein